MTADLCRRIDGFASPEATWVTAQTIFINSGFVVR
jgi:hypothetical protein